MTPMLDGGGLQPIKTQSEQDNDQNSTISENRKLIEENRKLIEKLGENFEGNQVIDMNDLPYQVSGTSTDDPYDMEQQGDIFP